MRLNPYFGVQVDSADELAGLKVLAESASGGAILDQGKTACCYANSEKHWTIDPQGLAWEHFYTMSDALTFGADTAPRTDPCCIPLRASNVPLAESQCVSVSAIKSRAVRARAMLKETLLACCHVEVVDGFVSDYHRVTPERCGGKCS